MLIVLQIIFWISVWGLFHSYLFYPFLLKILAQGKKENQQLYQITDDLPYVSVIMSLYNEEKVIQEKLDCLLALNYPKDRLHIFVGSDCSDDQTNTIVESFSDHSSIHFYPFSQRRGKPGVVNDLVRYAYDLKPPEDNHIFLLTDANVILDEDCLFHLIRHFKNEAIVLVDANMLNTGMRKEGISRSENRYVSNEVIMKNREGLLWGKMIGPFGGCYTIRSSYYEEVPATFLVDDFYITMKAFERKGMAINDLNAICYESVSHDIKEEYRRKARISAGNFQNLSTFRHLLWPPTDKLAFAFFSHKVLRWLGPFFIIFALVSSGTLALMDNFFYKILFLLQLVLLIGVPIIDKLTKVLGIHIGLFRNITYFNVMNIALLQGFFKFIKGIQNNVWQPPKRT